MLPEQEMSPRRRHRLSEVVWVLVWRLFFRQTPRWALGGWRRFLLRAFGARIGRGAVVHPTCRISAPWNLTIGELSCLGDHVDCCCEAPVTIGSRSTVSQNSMLCTATYDTTTRCFMPVAHPIVIEDFAWVAANAFVGPGVRIGTRAVAGAGAVVTENVLPWSVVGGNPARFIKRWQLIGDDGPNEAADSLDETRVHPSSVGPAKI